MEKGFMEVTEVTEVELLVPDTLRPQMKYDHIVQMNEEEERDEGGKSDVEEESDEGGKSDVEEESDEGGKSDVQQ